MNKRYIFLTGGNGEIGKSIKDEFVDFEIISPSSKEMDCSSQKSIRNYISKLKIPQIDIIIHCAGINIPESYIDVTSDNMMKTMQINAFSFLQVVTELTPFFVENKTKIIAISSIYGTISRIGRLKYSASKHALNGMIKTLALELAPRGILVNAISPGFIQTNLTFKNNSKETIDKIVSNIPIGRLGNPKEVAWYIRFLASDENSYMTGQNIIIDGGYIIGGYQK